MNAHALVQSRIVAALEALQHEGALPPGLDFAATEVAPPREAAHGELASNAAMVLAKPARLPPRAIAEKLAAKLSAAPDIDTVATTAGTTVDTAQRDTVYQQFQQFLNASGPFIPLVQPPSNIVTATSVTGAAYNPIWTVDLGVIGAK